MTTTKAKTTKTTKTKATKAAKPKAAAKKSTKTTKPKATAAKKSTKAAKPAAAKPVVDAPKAAKEPKVKKEKVAYDRAAPTDANPDGKTVTLKNGSVVPAFKYCANCDADHAAEEFYANAGRPSGLSDWCKAAFKAWKKASDAKKAAQA